VYKFTNKVLLGVLGFSLANCIAFGIEAEYKNSLMKIELNKANESAYVINLYTKNNFSEPVKVIKKSDLNYYILLPETKNESTRTTSTGTEIRSISTNVYPYAGQDVKNGYVKINIDTTKPLEFKVNVKNIDSLTKPSTNASVAQNPIKETVKKETVSTEKKNSSSNSKKEEIKPILKEEKPIVEPLKIEDAIKQEVEKAKEEMSQEDAEDFLNFSEEIIAQEEISEEILTEEQLNELEQIAGEKPRKKSGSISFKSNLSTKLAQYGISLKEFALMIGAFLLSFFFMLALLSRKTSHTRIKRKSELSENEPKPNFNLRHKEEVKNDGQYFVFDKNVKQTGFCDPMTSALKKNYELSSYEPELKNKYERNIDSANKRFESEYDIIQKILKEDTFIDLPAKTVVQDTPKAEIKIEETPKQEVKTASEPIKQEAKQEVKKPEIKPQPVEPTVLSSVEIAPERGFMCVSYNDNISLMGYIFDDVFALYNFKAQKLENYDIKFRLSEKDEKLARFIVKVADAKMLIKVTKSAMVMEVLL